MFKLDTNIQEIKGIPPKFAKKLSTLKIETVKDLLWHFPARYEDYSKIYNVEELIPGQQATIKGEVQKINTKRTWRRQMLITEARIADMTGVIRAVWWNQPYIENSLRIGTVANFAGKIREDGDGFYFSNPAYEMIRSNKETRHTARLVPIYPETRGLTSKGIRFLMKPILERSEEIKEFIPKKILEERGLPEINRAISAIHFPITIEAALNAKKRFVFEELFLLQLLNMKQRQAMAKEKAPTLTVNNEEFQKIINSLPFPLTQAQTRVLTEIFNDLKKPTPMNRLLQGDVGSGKTVVAALAALAFAYNNYQTAFMAPTEILARQHYETFKKLLAPLNQKVGIALLTSNEAKVFGENDLEEETTKKKAKEAVENGKIKIVLGTHALIQKDVLFNRIGLAIIDEQHRFGVRQRSQLLKSVQKEKLLPHLLSMSATPIPRTLTLTIFGDLDLSVIDEMPKGRQPIITKVVAPENRGKAYAFIKAQVKAGRQVFVICPRIESSSENEKSSLSPMPHTPYPSSWADIKNVTEEYEKLSKKIFPDLKVAMLHGKLKPKEKGEIMSAFASSSAKAMGDKKGSADKKNKIDLLVSTSVVEVGVDIPNATIMMIEGADRFGLAQLYQFRGRVGRGEHQSFCLLFTNSSSKSTKERLGALVTAKNGFELAEMDLKIRGPGEFLGSSQTGMPDIAMRALQNMELIKEGRSAAEAVLAKSSDLKKYPSLRIRTAEFEKIIHPE
ncbi:MAG: ATP-dependent DNA helicase RecG [Candidatus Liptonbacteria bacterium]|nr:ATP-dependent DNA helicase RecG [Candidatus Liptonbacteria bacterium]